MTDTQGKLLVAPPNMPDWRFAKSVVYMWKHDVSGAAGVIINKICKHPDFKHVCQEGGIKLMTGYNNAVYYGGPVLTNIIGVLHTKDVQLGSSQSRKQDELAYTLDRKMLEMIAQAGGPRKRLIMLGMANWEAGQLEAELDPQPPRPKTMSWITLDYDEDLVFTSKPDDLWETCVSRAVMAKTSEITSKIFKD